MAIIRFCVIGVILTLFLASQLFWFRQLAKLGERLIPYRPLRRGLACAGAILYIGIFAYMFAWSKGTYTPIELTPRTALLDMPFFWWLVGSTMGFGFILIFWGADRLFRTAGWVYRKIRSTLRSKPEASAPLVSSDRRKFLEQAAVAVSAAPFAISAYGLFYGRVNLQVTHHRLELPNLGKAFHGFRIAQLSDIHIGPFMPAEEIRKYVERTNELKPDLVALTGDFITWDPQTQEPVVEVLSGLKAPYGVIGCLGNHELWYEVEDSITDLFRRRGVRILRHERHLIQSGGDALNFVGVDYQSIRRMEPPNSRFVGQYLMGARELVQPESANVLLSHNPNTFDRAAELGFDLSLAGHTHGGQVTFEYIHPSITPSRLITSYVKGWYRKPGSQLYVNSGIGTMFVPARVGAPPEITVIELARKTG